MARPEVTGDQGGRPAVAIELCNVSLGYPHPQTGAMELAISDVSLTVAPGEFVSLIGPSGCGKTTVLNVISGFASAQAGEATLLGRQVRGIQSDSVAIMFARDTLLPWRTAIRNVEFALEIGSSRQANRAEAVRLLSLVGLTGYEEFYPSQLSQGMRQRVALARTLAANRPIVLMDEPFAALDAQTRTVMQGEFNRIWEADRKTVILVTHDLIEAIALSDRVVVMSPRPGRVKAVYRIDLPRPRVVVDLPLNPTFHELYRTLWQDLKEELPGLAEGETGG